MRNYKDGRFLISLHFVNLHKWNAEFWPNPTRILKNAIHMFMKVLGTASLEEGGNQLFNNIEPQTIQTTARRPTQNRIRSCYR